MSKGGFRIVRETSDPLPADLPYSLDHFSAAGNLIETLGYYPDRESARRAFDRAVRLNPQRHLRLRREARLITRHDPPAS